MNLSLLSALRHAKVAVLSASALLLSSAAAHAGTIAIVNGDFNTTAGSTEFGSRYGGQVVNGWTTNGYNFVFQAGTADMNGATGEDGSVKLWGPNDGSANGLPSSSPAGGSFIAMDGNYFTGAVSQTISGFNAGDIVSVSFYYAYAQQQGFSGTNTESLQVSLGGQTIATPTQTIASEGFSGWIKTTLNFAATSNSETLSFLASAPGGSPPFVLVDGVSATSTTPVPEPASLALLGTGLAGLGGMMRRRFRR